jgi:hypothetical protein
MRRTALCRDGSRARWVYDLCCRPPRGSPVDFNSESESPLLAGSSSNPGVIHPLAPPPHHTTASPPSAGLPPPRPSFTAGHGRRRILTTPIPNSTSTPPPATTTRRHSSAPAAASRRPLHHHASSLPPPRSSVTAAVPFGRPSPRAGRAARSIPTATRRWLAFPL